MTPEQYTGISKNLEYSIQLETQEDAEEMFVIAKQRLLDINKWVEVAATPSGTFTLTDKNGNELNRSAHKDDYVKINIGAPGPLAGNGRDWVHIEKIEYDDDPDANHEQISMQLRPVAAPNTTDQTVAHFFDDTATSTFIIERRHTKLKAFYKGRNEKPNTNAESFIDKARNLVVAASAILGLSDAQWNNLIKGFLKIESH